MGGLDFEIGSVEYNSIKRVLSLSIQHMLHSQRDFPTLTVPPHYHRHFLASIDFLIKLFSLNSELIRISELIFLFLNEPPHAFTQSETHLVQAAYFITVCHIYLGHVSVLAHVRAESMEHHYYALWWVFCRSTINGPSVSVELGEAVDVGAGDEVVDGELVRAIVYFSIFGGR